MSILEGIKVPLCFSKWLEFTLCSWLGCKGYIDLLYHSFFYGMIYEKERLIQITTPLETIKWVRQAFHKEDIDYILEQSPIKIYYISSFKSEYVYPLVFEFKDGMMLAFAPKEVENPVEDEIWDVESAYCWFKEEPESPILCEDCDLYSTIGGFGNCSRDEAYVSGEKDPCEYFEQIT